MTTKTKRAPKETYLFRRLDNGKIVRRRMTFDDRMNLDVLNRITLRGGVEAVFVGNVKTTIVTKATKGGRGIARWPMLSVALSVRPSEARRKNEEARAAGITDVSYDLKTGKCYIGSPKSQTKLLDLRYPNEPYVNIDGGSRKKF